MTTARPYPRYSELYTLVRVSFALRLLTLLAAMVGFVDQKLSWQAAVAVIVVMLTSIAGLAIESVPALLRRHPMLVVLDALVMTAVMVVLGTDNPLMLLTLSSCVIIGVLLSTVSAVLAALVLVCGYTVGTLASAGSSRSFTDIVGMPITFISFVAMAQAYRIIADRKSASERAFADLISSSATAEERARVARELHDSTAKTLQGLAMTAGSLTHWVRMDPERAISEASEIAASAELEVLRLRGLLTSLREDDLTQPFAESVAAVARAAAHGHGIRVLLDLAPVAVSTPAVRAELLAAIKEAITNAGTHSGTDRVSVRMSVMSDELTIVVSDQGVGFAQEILAERERDGHFGVRGFQERLELIGGSATIISAPSKGTIVELIAPVLGLREEFMADDLTIAAPATAADHTTVLIVDDNPIVRKGLRSLLETSPEITIVGEASDGVLAESMVHSLKPDVVLLDVRMPRRDGVETARIIAPCTTVIMLTFTDEPQHIRSALSAGASGYLVHGSFDAMSLVHTVRQAALGAGAFSPQALSVLRGDATPETAGTARHKEFGLSDRQRELMDLIAQGRSNAEIAVELFLAEKTVKNHINAIFGKLVVANRGEAIALWLGNRERGR